MFGTKWTNAYGAKPDPNNVWANALSGLTQKDLSRGLKRLGDSGAEWPPTAPEFRKLCIHFSQNEIDEIRRKEDMAAMPLPKPRNKEVGLKWIQKINKEILGRKI